MGIREPEEGSTFFYRRVIKTTNGRLLNLTPVIPANWEVVKVIPKNVSSNRILLTIIRMTGDNNHAQDTTGNKSDKQDASETR